MKAIRRVLFVLAGASLLYAGSPDPQISIVHKNMSAHEIATSLKKGGFVIYMRHSVTRHDENDRTNSEFDNCKLQRNLSKEGVEIAAKVGKAISKLGIPIGKVISSPYCRCKDTAKNAFGKITVDNDLRFALVSDVDETKRLKRHLLELLLQEPEAGTNSVLVGHTANLKEAVGVWPKPEAVIEVFKKVSDRTIEFYGKIEPDDWKTIVNDEHN